MAALVVPDASVLMKWVLRGGVEDDADRALALQRAWLAGAIDLAVPTLWLYEVGNVLGQKAPADADALLGAMIDLRLPEVAPAAYLTEAVRLMRKFRVTFYDAAYHALALTRRGVMLTADRRYVAAAGSAGRVQLLNRWERGRE